MFPFITVRTQEQSGRREAGGEGENYLNKLIVRHLLSVIVIVEAEVEKNRKLKKIQGLKRNEREFKE